MAEAELLRSWVLANWLIPGAAVAVTVAVPFTVVVPVSHVAATIPVTTPTGGVAASAGGRPREKAASPSAGWTA